MTESGSSPEPLELPKDTSSQTPAPPKQQAGFNSPMLHVLAPALPGAGNGNF